MPPLIASTVCLGVLGAIDTYITATILPLPVWVTFIAWASFFACGGGTRGLLKSVISNWTGIIVASLALLMIQISPEHPIYAAIFVGAGTSVMILTSALRILDFPPAIVFGFASLVGTAAATQTTVLTPGIHQPTITAMAAMLLGGVFGLISQYGTQMLKSGRPALA